MCGIFAYIGLDTSAPKLAIEGLKKLEYRGYDSWGITFQSDGTLQRERKVGKISDVITEDYSATSSVVIAHTRWATHGGVTLENTHPHCNKDSSIAVVHNGIIENYELLKQKLQAKGYNFVSQTDTEVVVHLIDDLMLTKQLEFSAAATEAFKQLKGRYAVVAIHKNSDYIVAARQGSPLIIGTSDTGFFIASDVPAFLEHTRTVQYIDDGEVVILNKKGVVCTDLLTGELHPKRTVEISWQPETAEKGEYTHFMMKEIMDQKVSIARAANQNPDEVATIAMAIAKANDTFLVGCGTAEKACRAAEYFFSVVARHHVNAVPASEFTIYHHLLTDKSLLVVVSQSGETADVLEAMQVAKQAGSKVLAIVNTEGSTIAREADFTLLINAGPERAVASTKAVTGQMSVLLLVAYALNNKLHDGATLVHEAAAAISDYLNPRYSQFIANIAEIIAPHNDLYIIGKSWHWPMALESAIKIQEVSYIHAEGFAGGELKHGPIALIEEGTPCLALVGDDETWSDMINNIIELKARGAIIVAISSREHSSFDHWIKVPDVGNAQPIATIIPVHVLAYHLALLRQVNPDMPRNLAKSVTVK